VRRLWTVRYAAVAMLVAAVVAVGAVPSAWAVCECSTEVQECTHQSLCYGNGDCHPDGSSRSCYTSQSGQQQMCWWGGDHSCGG
jgi:hypothetical protein